MPTRAPRVVPRDDLDGWIRLKLQAGLPLDAAEEAYLQSLPPDDPLRQSPPVRGKPRS